MLNNILLVGIGGFLGSVTRYLSCIGINRFLPTAVFPWGTFVVNVLGCFFIGFLGGLAVSKQFLAEHSRLFLFTGILGGFTTFSAFGIETFYLMRQAQWFLVALNIIAQVGLGIAATAVGYGISKAL